MKPIDNNDDVMLTNKKEDKEGEDNEGYEMNDVSDDEEEKQ